MHQRDSDEPQEREPSPRTGHNEEESKNNNSLVLIALNIAGLFPNNLMIMDLVLLLAP